MLVITGGRCCEVPRKGNNPEIFTPDVCPQSVENNATVARYMSGRPANRDESNPQDPDNNQTSSNNNPNE